MDFETKLYTILKKYDKFCDKNGDILKSKLKDYAFSFDEDLLKALLQYPDIKIHFFKEVLDCTIFDFHKFIDFIEDKNFLLDSYTKFSNKIGLNIKNRDISSINDVVLDFAFKDCVLKGGQTKDEEKTKEIFFNETLAIEEINRLFDKKILTNIKKYSLKNSKIEHNSNIEFTKDSNGLIKDNLIIKGNNLLALHTLKSNFANKIKLIYIDPPYNTGNDSFKYNDNFNHSTWLVFMKNRLEIARELLSDDGVIFVSIDDNEQAYLKVLMDEIFGRENFIGNIIRKTGSNRNMGDIRTSLDNRHENLLLYKKSSHRNILYGMSQSINKNEIYTQDFTVRTGGYCYSIPSLDFSKTFKRNWAIKESSFKALLGGDNNSTYNELYKNVKKIDQKSWYQIGDFIFKSLSGIVNKIKIKKDKRIIHSLWTDLESQKNINEHFKELSLDFPNAKLESFIKRIIEISTKPNDIVLDFHLGSGTTCAVAHKMNRQYIGIEQMDYIEDISVKRLEKVIEGEGGGISKSVDWKGGGEFIYMQLDVYNQKFIDDIYMCSEDNILDIYKNICKKGFLNYDVDLKKIDTNLQEFKNLSLDDKKEFLISILNKNMLYKNLSEIDDEEFNIDENTKRLNKEFYN